MDLSLGTDFVIAVPRPSGNPTECIPGSVNGDRHLERLIHPPESGKVVAHVEHNILIST